MSIRGSDNFFTPAEAAARYARGRPYFHGRVIERIQHRLQLGWPVSRALDVACGTGLSTVALKPLARRIVGTDISEEMIARAPVDPHITYVVAPAEHLPFPDAHFDLLTLSSALHWLDAPAFFQEAKRVLHRDRYLAVYDNVFLGATEGNPTFQARVTQDYLSRYPSPPRTQVTLPATAEAEGLEYVGGERYENVVKFSLGRLVDYLVTQSNVMATVEGGHESIGEVRAWLTQTAAPFFGGDEELSFLFAGPIWYFRRP
ncbi:MAG TPA: methyltransferase domain-containing protein [Chloroflexota bacterium]|nr:methyltransferase domain-containing protein [Chloroflexota bacterium]